jgi:orotidine-5'-phosphate decarboxylase
MNFITALKTRWQQADTLVCVGLDPEPSRFPARFANDPDAVFNFCRDIVDTTAEHVCAFKPQIAHFAGQRAEPQLEAVCAHVRDRYPDVVLILDAKRGDIGSTSEHYAREAFDRYGADAVTVNPYLGTDAAAPFLERGGVLAVCRTSNPGSGELQDLPVDGGEPLYQRVARLVAERWAAIGECGLVVGATFPAQLGDVRAIVGELPILVPGVGEQRGELEASVKAGATDVGTGLIVSSSRAVLYASPDADFAEAARTVASATRAAIRAAH